MKLLKNVNIEVGTLGYFIETKEQRKFKEILSLDSWADIIDIDIESVDYDDVELDWEEVDEEIKTDEVEWLIVKVKYWDGNKRKTKSFISVVQ